MENTFYAPKTIQELIELLKLKKNSSDIYFVAGATDFMINIRKKGIMDFSAIDLTHLDRLKMIEKKKDCIEIGSGVTMTELEQSNSIRQNANALAQAASKVGSTQIRNRATVGGNIANAIHCADTITATFALAGTAILLNSEGKTRELPLEEFVLGFGRTQIKEDEVLIKIRIPNRSKRVYSSFSKVGSRKRMTISKLNHAVKLEFKGNDIVEAAMYFGSIGAKAIKAVKMENHCLGREWDEILMEELFELGANQIDEAIPTRASRHYKRVAVKGMIHDVFNDILSQRGGCL